MARAPPPALHHHVVEGELDGNILALLPVHLVAAVVVHLVVRQLGGAEHLHTVATRLKIIRYVKRIFFIME